MNPTVTRFPPGTLFADRYELLRSLGGGGMSEVYLARDRLLGREVAVKVIRPELATDEKSVARFRREARAAAALSHPGIVAIHDVGVHAGAPFIVMERVEGRTLTEILREDGRVSPDRVAEIGAEVARALSAAHAAGIIHRDVKPGNVMITPSGRAKVLDFGIAHATRWTPLTEARVVHGTAEYMAPEQIRGEGADPRSDQYALGAVLYELLAGQPPFHDETPLAIAYHHLEDTPPPIQSSRPDVPPGLAAVIARAMAKDRGHRYRSAEEMALDLERVREGKPASTVRMPPGADTRVLHDRREPPSRRRSIVPWLAGGVAAALAVVTAVAVLMAALDRDRPRPRGPRPPAELTATGGCEGFLDAQVRLEWSMSRSPRADGYEVYRGETNGGPYERIGFVTGRSELFYLDRDVSLAETYFYVVRSTRGNRSGPPSGQAQATAPPACVLA
ncbi:MAG TPA: protein kinase [Actinomycetota bacterium]|nr:protein kinase [Actinomycetota bacterium]